ncbi:MFS transporter, DHA1 family, bicyclomycin/chloramphenicol resistance protein [Sulfitobacter brevis]|uniref:Bcr/CflA family efflux transporter n=1 Tax=Sulfitobacter brevis TaxID=74348 RepID=A0A1I2D9B1_9RHOB|nr:multidrug effflux MFS transporter [Sulfitobacter brevis]SFE76703.1 MFS transporter, DHA1 family, bicyclomycin/chloramphenicol resistance protein [Sulfitobacter brevis]
MTAKPIMSERRVSLLGALLVAVGPVSMALYTPAMTELVTAFGSTDSVVKLTLTLYFGGFAFAQLVAGPLSDVLGRRPVTIAFMALYCAGSLLALFAPTMTVLILARFIQGVGASVGVATSRALVRDLFTRDQSSRIMNLIGIVLALGPAFAPTLGGLILWVFGWRSLFVVMLAIGLGVIATVYFCMAETVVADRKRLNFKTLAGSYRNVLGNAHFVTASGVIAGALGAIYAQATFLPFILMNDLGLSPQQFGLAMLAQSGSFFVASLVARQLIARIGADRLVAPGLVFILAGSAGTATLLLWPPSFLHVMVPVAIYACGIALVMPAMSTAALAPFTRTAGAAAALMGFFQMGAGLLMGSLGALLGDTLVAMGIFIPLMGVAACLSYLIHLRVREVAPDAATPDGAQAPAAKLPTPAE